MNNPLLIDIGLHWTTIFIYVFVTLFNTYGLIFEKSSFEKFSYRLLYIGLSVHTFVLLYRWWYVGHGPYLTKYEIISSHSWMVLVLFLVFSRFFPRIRAASIMIFPSAFLLLAIALFLNPQARMLPPTLNSIWLVLHVAFYKIALGTLILGLGFSFFYCMKKRSGANWLDRLPDLPALDLLAFRFAGFGFTFWAIAMLAGSIWAYQSWGRFWAWDPVENWSLLTWALFGIYLHLRRFFGWYGDRAAVFFAFCFTASILALFFTPALNSSIHSEYFK